MTMWGNEDDGWLEQAYEDRQTGGYEDDLSLIHDDPWDDKSFYEEEWET